MSQFNYITIYSNNYLGQYFIFYFLNCLEFPFKTCKYNDDRNKSIA